MKKTNRKVSKSTLKKTWKRTVNGARRHNTKVTSATRKRETENQRLNTTMDKIVASSQFKKVQKLLEQIGTCLSQTREARYNFIATIYCHIGDTFGNDDFEKGAKKYLLRLFPVSEDEDQKKLHQSFRNKYNRALRFLRDKKVSYADVDKVVKIIKKIGLQTLFNGKENDTGKKSSSKATLKDNVQNLMKKNDAVKIIQQVLSIQANEKIKGDFVLCYADGRLSYSTKSKLANKLANGDNLLEKLPTANDK